MAGEPEKTQTVEGEATWSLRVGRPPLDINIFRKEKVRPGTHPHTRTHARTHHRGSTGGDSSVLPSQLAGASGEFVSPCAVGRGG